MGASTVDSAALMDLQSPQFLMETDTRVKVVHELSEMGYSLDMCINALQHARQTLHPYVPDLFWQPPHTVSTTMSNVQYSPTS